MFTVIVNFKLPEGITREELISKFDQTISKWRNTPELISKSYIIDLDKGIAGGVYLWKEKIHANIWLGAEFKKMVKDNYDVEPILHYFETPIVVDNIAGSITKE